MRISVVTVCFNAAAHISACLQSVASQTYSDIEHIVIDGASSDDTLAIVRQYPHVATLVSEPDGGIYDAMNKGIVRATGDLILFLNADDRFASDESLAAAAVAVDAIPDGDVYYGSLEVRGQDGLVSVYHPDPPEGAAALMVCGCLPHQSTLARPSAFQRTKNFDTRYRYHADYDWFLKIIHDDEIRLCQIDTVVGSFYAGGVSSNLENTQSEVYTIQNASPLYRSAAWDRKRIEIYQQAFLTQRLATTRAHYQKVQQDQASRLNIALRPRRNRQSRVKTRFYKLLGIMRD